MISFLMRLLGLGPSARLAPGDFVARRGPDEPVVDVRTPQEYASGHLAGAINVDVTAPDFPDRIAALAADGTLRAEGAVYLYCRSGVRSGRATRILREMGYTEAWNVGGLGALKAAGADVTP